MVCFRSFLLVENFVKFTHFSKTFQPIPTELGVNSIHHRRIEEFSSGDFLEAKSELSHM